MKMKMRREDQGTVFLSFPFSPTRGPAGKIPPPLVDLIYNVFGPFSFKTLNWTLHGHKLVLHLERWPLLFDFLTTISTNKLSIIALCFITYTYTYTYTFIIHFPFLRMLSQEMTNHKSPHFFRVKNTLIIITLNQTIA